MQDTCKRCQRIKRKCICRRERNWQVVDARSRTSAGSMGDKRKERSRKACRGRYRDE